MDKNYLMPTIPAYVTVLLSDNFKTGETITVSFPDYIKGVASATLDCKMHEQALTALLYAQISFALYRINSKYYRNKKYAFDITDDPDIDQPFIYNGIVCRKINDTVDRIFTEYISYDLSVQPIEARVCYKQTQGCKGMSLDGCIELALNGKNYETILKYYYGDNIYIEKNAKISGLQTDSLLTGPLNAGDMGRNVSGLQIALNRISSNYKTISKIENVDGVYNEITSKSVCDFQRIFNLSETGNVDKCTYHKLMYVYDSVRKINYLVKEGEKMSYIPSTLKTDLKYGSMGNNVKILQYYLLFISVFEKRIPPLEVIGYFGDKTYQSVISFQRVFGLVPNGIVDNEVWNTLINVYRGTYSSLPKNVFSSCAKDYPGYIMLLGSDGEGVKNMQEYLNTLSKKYEELPECDVNGYFDEQTENTVKIFQKMFGIKDTGVVSSTTWAMISRIYNAVNAGE